MPVFFQCQQALGEIFGVTLADEIAAVVAQNIDDVRLGIPAQSAPDGLVHVVVAAFGIADEADRVRLQQPEDRGHLGGTRVDSLPSLRNGEGRVPIGDRVLALPAMSDVRIVAQGIFFRNRRAQLRQAQSHLRAEDHAAEPGRLFLVEDREEFIEPLLVEALRGNPHLRRGMKTAEHLRLLLQQRHQKFRPRVAGIAARHEHRVQPRQLFKHLAPLAQREFHGPGIRVFLVQRGIPEPHVQSVIVEQPGHAAQHLQRREGKMRAGFGIVRTRRNQLHRVAAKDGQVANILLPDSQIPRVIRMGLGTITELMPAKLVSWSAGDFEIRRQRDAAVDHPQGSE